MIIRSHNTAIKSGTTVRQTNTFYRPMRTGLGNWMSVCNYVAACKDVRSSICRSCGTGRVYDKNDVAYTFTTSFSIEDIKTLIEKVRIINSNE